MQPPSSSLLNIKSSCRRRGNLENEILCGNPRERNRRRRVSLRIRGKLENEISSEMSSCRGKTTRARAHVQRMSLLRFSITKQQRTKRLELCNVSNHAAKP